MGLTDLGREYQRGSTDTNYFFVACSWKIVVRGMHSGLNSNLDEVTKVDYSVVIGKRPPVAELDDRSVDDWERTAEFTKYDDGWRVTKLE